MRWLSSTLCLLVAACAQTWTADLAIRGATVVDVTDGSLISGQIVLVEGNRIVAVGPADAVGDAARAFAMTDSLGTVEVGKLADLVLLDANPLEDIIDTRRIGAVVADGRLYRRSDLDRLITEVAALNRQQEIIP